MSAVFIVGPDEMCGAELNCNEPAHFVVRAPDEAYSMVSCVEDVSVAITIMFELSQASHVTVERYTRESWNV